MVNKTQFNKTKIALAVVLSLGLAACGDSDGDAGSTANTTANTVTEAVDNTIEQVSGTGSVQGTVLDTNGLPVMGATVSLAGQSVLTDASGYYYFTNVPLPGVDGVNSDEGNDDDIDNAGYLVTITAPAGYANATVNVQLEDIQVDSGNNGSADNSGDVNSAGEQTTWFDGFLAQATTANLPKFAASVTGVLRDCNTGAALAAGATVALDFTAISVSGTNTGTNVGIGVPVYTTTVGENGVFTFSDIPTDSDFDLAVQGYSLVSTGSAEATEAGLDDVTVRTTAEGIQNNLGDMNVCLITSSDNVAPFITSVNDTISNTTDEGFTWQVLGQGVDGTQGIVIKFNEALNKDSIVTSNIVVTSQVDFTDDSAGESLVAIDSATVAEDGMSITVTLASALPEMTKFSVWMPRHEYEDTSANRIITGDDTTGANDADQTDQLLNDVADLVTAAASNEVGILNDYINSTQFKTEYVRTRLCTYIAPDFNADGADGEQLVKLEDTLPVSAFWDNGGALDISNLNGQAGTTDVLLTQLAAAKGGTATVQDNVAVIVGSMGNASGIQASTGTVTTGGGDYEVVVLGASHGQTVTMTPTAAFNIIGTPFSVTLEDKVRPTTVLQDAYDYADTFGAAHVTTDGVDDPTFGDGAELANIGTSAVPGAPTYYVTPRLFAQDRAGDRDAAYNNRPDQFRALAQLNTLNTAATPAPYVTSTTNFVYDVNAWAAWAGEVRTIGFALDENVEILAATTPSFSMESGAVTSTLTDFTVNNAVVTEDYLALNADRTNDRVYMAHGLVQAETNNVLSLANDDHGAVVSFSGVLADAGRTANVASTDAVVVIRDAIPAFVTKAELDATTFTVDFNEAVSGTVGSIVITDPDTGAQTPLAMSAAVMSNSDMTATWSGASLVGLRGSFSGTNAVALTADIDDTALFGNVAENETVTGDFSFPEVASGTALNHSLLSWSSVQDARGNSWGGYTALYVDTTDATGIPVIGNGTIDSQEDGDPATNGWRLALQDLPMFLATDTIVPFGVTVAFGALDEDGTPGVDANFTITITATNPISLTNNAGAVGYLTATDTEVAAEDGWRALGGAASNVTDGWDLSEINTHFRLVDSGALQTALNLDFANSDAVVNGGNNDGQVSPEEYENFNGGAALLALYDANDFPMIAGTGASFNTDNTVLTISATVAANTIAQGAGVEFVKITPTRVNITGAAPGGALNTNAGNEVTPDALVPGTPDDLDVRFGHIEGTILGTNNEEQSGSVKREL